MAIFLQVAAGRNAGQEIPVRGPRFLIGRAEDCQLRAHSEQISRYHCALIMGRGELLIRDYGSRNGTFVDGRRVVNQLALQDGQKLQLGPLSFVVRIRKGATEAGGAGKDTVLGKAASDTMHAADAQAAPSGEESVKQAAQAMHNAPEPLDVLQFLSEPDSPSKTQHRDTALRSLEDFLAAEKAAAERAAAEKAAGKTPEPPPSSEDETREAALEGLKRFYSPKKQ